MKWFQGSIPEAIGTAKSRGSVFIVYIEGEDEMSKNMEDVWEESTISAVCEAENCVGLRLKSGSELCTQFGQIYPIVCIPCTFFIGNNGVPLEVVGGNLPSEEFIKKIKGAAETNRGGSAPPTSETSSPEATSPPLHQAAATPSAQAGDVNIQENSPDNTASDAPQPESFSKEPGARLALEEKVRKANELIEEKRRQKAEQEKLKQRQAEIERREVGQNLNRFKQMKGETEADEIKQARLKEKREAKMAKDRVRQQIAQDRAERSEKYRKEKDDRQSDAEARAAMTREATEQAQSQADKTRMETARIQFRLPDGRAINHQFQSSETLQTARDFLTDRVASLGRFTMRTSFPKRTFTDEDFTKTLLDLQLAPSAAIIILPASSQISRSGAGGGSESIFAWILWPIMAVWGFMYNFLFGTASTLAPPSSGPQAPITSQPQPSTSGEFSSNRSRPKSSYGIRQRREGNMHRLSAEDDDDDERTTWNGNSTQQL